MISLVVDPEIAMLCKLDEFVLFPDATLTENPDSL
jgi:hypothetical protein